MYKHKVPRNAYMGFDNSKYTVFHCSGGSGQPERLNQTQNPILQKTQNLKELVKKGLISNRST